jgi:hypothetical protein
MSSLPAWLTNHADLANLFAAVLIVIISALIYWTKPKVFAKHAYMSRAFQMWIWQWFAFIAIFVVLAIIQKVYPNFGVKQSDLVVLLSFVDLQTVFALGCGLYLLHGNLKKKVFPRIGIVFLCLLSWNVIIGLLFISSQRTRELWVLPSRMFAMLGFLCISVVLILRSKLIAVPFLVISIAYATVQLPVYSSIFVIKSPSQNWFVALALGKLLLALTFYPSFFLISHHKEITLERLVAGYPALAKTLAKGESRVIPYIAHWLVWLVMLVVTEIIRQVVLSQIRGGK